MRASRAFIVVGFCVLLIGTLDGCGPKPRSVVDPAARRSTASGAVVGLVGEYGSHVWLGVPFAAPPVGALRWRAPLPPQAWTGTREALAFGSACTQYASPFGGVKKAREGINEEQFSEVRRKVTMVFQSGALFDSLTVADNIAFPLEGQPGLTQEDIDQYVDKLAHVLEVDEVLDKLPGELSTGNRRAVAIARALAQNPDAILYDEPTTMVDPIMAAHMGDLIARLKDTFHKTSIVVTHDTHLAKKLADMIVFLQDGKSTVFDSWAAFENSKDEFLHNFLLQDKLIPALDVTL